MARASRATSDGLAEEADLDNYGNTVHAFLGPESFQGIKGAIDTDAPISPPVAGPLSSPESPGTPELDQLPGPFMLERFSSLTSDVLTMIAQPGPSHGLSDSSWSSGSTSASLMEDDSVTFTEVDPAVDNIAGGTLKPNQSPALGDLQSLLRAIAEDVRRRAIASERERENVRQHLQYEARMVSLLEEIKEQSKSFQATLSQHFVKTEAFYTQLLDTIQILSAGILGTTPDHL